MTREYAVKILRSEILEPYTGEYPTDDVIEATQMGIEALENQKMGHWIDDEFGSKCSCCDIHTHLDKFGRPMKFKHCSMCGAKIGGE